jgi:hypothetical protein
MGLRRNCTITKNITSRIKRDSYRLFLDDVRIPLDIFKLTGMEIFADPDWTVTTNYDSFVDTIIYHHVNLHILPSIISFDHDLGIIDITPEQSKFISVFVAKEEKLAKSGYDCARWLIDYFNNEKLKLPQILVHSQNPVGRQNIINLFNSRSPE